MPDTRTHTFHSVFLSSLVSVALSPPLFPLLALSPSLSLLKYSANDLRSDGGTALAAALLNLTGLNSLRLRFCCHVFLIALFQLIRRKVRSKE
jgi:hypothetical protein